MEHMPIKRSRKNKKPIYLLFSFLIFFVVFIYAMTRPSLLSRATDEIQICGSISEVRLTFEKYKYDLLETDENGKKIVSVQLQDAVREKLHSFYLTEEALKECLEWLPPAKTSLNIIIIPDLSRRIIDTVNNPDQVSNDIMVLNSVWQSFINNSKFKQDTRDRLIVDVTDIDQAQGQFGIVASQLQFDLSTHKGKSNWLYFTAEKDHQFSQAVITMYESAKEKPLGADYPFYFRRYLVNHLQKPSLYDKYVNKVIIITDGYLEAEDRPADTKITPQLYRSVEIGNTTETIDRLGLNIPKVQGVDLSNTDVLVCEVNERRKGKTKDFEILKSYWEDWLIRMKANKVSFIQRELSNELTKKRIEEFISK